MSQAQKSGRTHTRHCQNPAPCGRLPTSSYYTSSTRRKRRNFRQVFSMKLFATHAPVCCSSLRGLSTTRAPRTCSQWLFNLRMSYLRRLSQYEPVQALMPPTSENPQLRCPFPEAVHAHHSRSSDRIIAECQENRPCKSNEEQDKLHTPNSTAPASRIRAVTSLYLVAHQKKQLQVRDEIRSSTNTRRMTVP